MIQAEIIQNMFNVILTSDQNIDFQIGPIEMEILIVRLGLIDGVEFDEKEFRKVIAQNQNKTLKSIFGIIQAMNDCSDNEVENPIFHLNPENISRVQK